MRDERTDGGTRDRTGQFGGDDGALEHERAEIAPGEDPGIRATPTGAREDRGRSDADQAVRQQQRDLETGEENPG